MQIIPISQRAYISATSYSSVTISGPPSTLKQLFSGASSFGTNRLEVPIHGPYHASHLHSGLDAQQILQYSEPRVSQILDQYQSRLPIMSTSAGTWIDKGTSAKEIFTAIIKNILNEPLRLDEVLHTCVKTVVNSGSSKCEIIACGPTNAASSFVRALKSETMAEVALHQEPLQAPSTLRLNQNPRTSRKPKLAIVGMAGRFPDAADAEKFWELLNAGLDVHREVRICYKFSVSDDNADLSLDSPRSI